MSQLSEAFEERYLQIEAYLNFLEGVERQIQSGPPRIGKDGMTITATQQKILYSSVYLQLYNLIEATTTNFLDAVSSVTEKHQWLPADLSDELLREWVRFTARTHEELNADNRLESALALSKQLVQALPISALKVKKSGGNWDDKAIDALADRLGLSLRVSVSILQDIKRPYRNEKGPMQHIKDLRNDLAHGTLSFEECGEGITVRELRDLTQKTVTYMRAVVEAFSAYLDSHGFLQPQSRPVPA